VSSAVRPRGSEPDYGPLLVFGSLVMVGLGMWGGSSLFQALRARRVPASTPSDPTGTPPDDGGPVATR